MELKSVILLLMYIPFFDFPDFIEIPICSLSTMIPEHSIVFKACSWSSKSSPHRSSFKFVSESIIGKRKRDAQLRCISSVRNNPPTVFTSNKYHGSGSSRPQDLRVMGGSFPVSCSRSARHGETAAQGH